MKTNNCICGSNHVILESVNNATVMRVVCDDCGRYTIYEQKTGESNRETMKKAVEKWNRLVENETDN